MNTIKCKYNWDEATVELLFSDGTKVALLCKGIEADLSIGIKAQGKTELPQGGKTVEYAVMALNGTLQAYCRSGSTSPNTLYKQYKERYPDMSDEQIRSLVREWQM